MRAAISNSFPIAVQVREGDIRYESALPTLNTAAAVALGIVLLLCPRSTSGQNPSKYAFVIASGFLCDPSEPSTCPAITKSDAGDSYEISGAGSFDLQSKSIKAAGTFTNRAANSNVLGTGVWIATELVTFDSYGIAPNALLHKGLTGHPQFGSKHLPAISGSMPSGGLAVFRIVLLPVSGKAKAAVLQVNCVLGEAPHERSVEGIRVTVDAREFSEEKGGRVMFLLMRPEVAPAPQQETPTASPEHN